MTGGGQGLFIDGASGDSTTSDGLDRLESKLRLTTNKERILHHNLELYLIIVNELYARTFQKLPEGSGTFRNLPEPS